MPDSSTVEVADRLSRRRPYALVVAVGALYVLALLEWRAYRDG